MSIVISKTNLIPTRRDKQVSSITMGSGGGGVMGSTVGGSSLKGVSWSGDTLVISGNVYVSGDTRSYGDVMAFGSTDAPLNWWDSLPTASTSVKGGIKIGEGLSIDNDGYVSVSGGTGVSSWNDLRDKPSTFTPSSHNNSQHSENYITGINSGMVTTALGFTPYNSTNPSGYITSSDLSPYATLANSFKQVTYQDLNAGHTDFSNAKYGLTHINTPTGDFGYYQSYGTGSYGGQTFIDYSGNDYFYYRGICNGSPRAWKQIAPLDNPHFTSSIGFRYSSSDNNFYNYITGIGNTPLELSGGKWTGDATQVGIKLSTNTAGAVNILNNGNMGIGKTPVSKLDVDGEVRASSFTGNAYPYTSILGSGADVTETAVVAGSTAGLKSYVGVYGGNSGSGSIVTIGTASAERMRIDSTGIVQVIKALAISSHEWIGFYDMYFDSVNQAADIRFGNLPFTGQIEISITSTYSGADANGTLIRLFNIGQNPNNAIWHNQSRTVEAWGGSANQVAIGDYQWDAGVSAFKIPISHLTIYPNPFTIRVRIHSYSNAISAGSAVSVSGNYTLTSLAKNIANYPEVFTFNSNLNVTGEVTAYYSSDERLKQNIKSFKALDTISKLKPVEYNWNDTAVSLNNQKNTETKNYGLIAQELEEVLPELIHPIYDGKYKAIDYEQLIPILIQAIKEQQQQIKYLKSDLDYVLKNFHK